MRVLVDTSVWIDHLRGAARSNELASLLLRNRVVTHSWVVGELSLGNLGSRRESFLSDLRLLSHVEVVSDAEVGEMIRLRALQGRGIGWVDAQLLAAALVGGVQLWTLDRNLTRIAAEAAISWSETRD